MLPNPSRRAPCGGLQLPDASRHAVAGRITPRGATRLSGKIRLQARLLRAEISLRLGLPREPAISASSRLLPSRLLRSEISFRPAGLLLDCAAANEGKGMAAKSETALWGTAARPPAYTCRSRCRPRGRGAPGTSRPTMGAMVRVHGCMHGVCMVRGHGAYCA